VAPCSKLPKTDLNVRIGKNKNPFQEREKWRTVVSSAMPLLLLSNPVGASGFGELVEARAKNTHCNVPPGLLYDLRFSGAEFTSWFLVVKATHGSRLKSRPSREGHFTRPIVQEYRSRISFKNIVSG